MYINTKVIFHENLYFNLKDFNQKTPFKNLFIILSSLMLFFIIRKIRFKFSVPIFHSIL